MTTRRLRIATSLGLALVGLGGLLFVPEGEPTAPAGAGKQPFAWRQDRVWAELERQFVAARASGCAALSNQITAALSQADAQLGQVATGPRVPEDSLFAELETNVLGLAAMIGACPEHLPEYIAIVNRLRRETKRQSQHWDLNSPPARHRTYRLLFGSRLALEEVMLQAPAWVRIPELVTCDDEPSGTPAARILGATLHSGDILVSRGGAPTSALIARGNDYPGNFSHVALVHVDAVTGQPVVVEAHIERGLVASSFEDYLADTKLRVMVLRLRADLPALKAQPLLPHYAAASALEQARQHHIPYDFAMDFRDHGSLFCSEVASSAYEKLGVKLWMGISSISSPTVTAWLGSLGVRHFETQEPSDLEYDPQLTVVAEWRAQATLFKAHVDDAATDVMLEKATPGVGLRYNRLLLPLARIYKACCATLNAFGRVGPVPEGMSATTALRVKKYRHDHAALAARLIRLAEDFERVHGYRPPYWQLIDLARQAAREPLAMGDS